MEIISTLPGDFFVTHSIALPTITILGCWVYALSMGAVKLWPWPMISDCFWEIPTKFFARYGLITSAVLLTIDAVLVRDFVRREASRQRKSSSLAPEEWGVYLAGIASLGLAVVADCNEYEAPYVHYAGAVVYFLFYILYMWIMSWRITHLGHLDVGVSRASLNVKLLLTAICTLDFLCFVYVALKDIPGSYQAILEWVGTFIILVFNWTFRFDFKDRMSLATVYSQPVEQGL